MWTSATDQGEVILSLPYHLKTTKKKWAKLIKKKKQYLKHWTSSKEVQWSLRGWVEVSLSPAFCLERALMLCNPGRRHLGGDWHAPRVKELELRSRETNMDRVLQTKIPEKKHLCTGKDLHSPWVFKRIMNSAWLWEKLPAVLKRTILRDGDVVHKHDVKYKTPEVIGWWIGLHSSSEYSMSKRSKDNEQLKTYALYKTDENLFL